MKYYDKTHRCEGSLRYGVSVRRDVPEGVFAGEWSADHLDATWGANELGGVYHIAYCPWCGVKLDKTIKVEAV